jgi:hypothetical protein
MLARQKKLHDVGAARIEPGFAVAEIEPPHAHESLVEAEREDILDMRLEALAPARNVSA